jgi:hypothetical protein
LPSKTSLCAHSENQFAPMEEHQTKQDSNVSMKAESTSH